MKNIIYFVFEILEIVILALAIVLPIRLFLFQPFLVKGQSMEPNFENGDYLIVDEITYRFREPQRGEVIVFKFPKNPSQRFIKRIIGLPGETVEIKDGKIKIINEKRSQILDESNYLSQNLSTPGNLRISLKMDEYFVLGDNRFFSLDSREFGPLKRKDIIGRVFIRVWPFTAFAKIGIPIYERP